MTAAAAPTVRESLESAMETVVAEQTPAPETPSAEPSSDAPQSSAPAQETEEQKAERLRNKDGTFAKGKAGTKPTPQAAPPAAKPVPAAPKAPRPSSWKKELETHWDTLAPEVQAYIGEREKQYASGVSTYKTEADRAKGVMQALSEFEPALQQHGIRPDQWVQNLGRAHYRLAMGSPQEKVQMAQKLITDYGIDAQALFQVMSGQQPTYQQTQQPYTPPQPQIDLKTVQQTVQEELANARAEQDYQAFTKAVDEKGTPKYQHFEAVKGTMAGLLQAGLAQDYPSAYDAALRMPQHSDIWNAMQEQQNAQKEADRQATEKAKVGRARSQAVSVKSSTPSTMTSAEGPKSLREELAANFDRVTASRV